MTAKAARSAIGLLAFSNEKGQTLVRELRRFEGDIDADKFAELLASLQSNLESNATYINQLRQLTPLE